MAVQIRLSAPSEREILEAIATLGPSFSPTGQVSKGRKGGYLCYGVLPVIATSTQEIINVTPNSRPGLAAPRRGVLSKGR
jgi:hypothetical protein